jgi:predicted glycosyl hydrolase (DUF1957 family)
MTTGTMTDYAIKRTKDHVARFLKLFDSIENYNIDEKILLDYELRDNIFHILITEFIVIKLIFKHFQNLSNKYKNLL